MKPIISKVRIEIHLSERETELLDSMANMEGRSRKNFCETEMRKVIQLFLQQEKDKELLSTPLLLPSTRIPVSNPQEEIY